MNYRIFVNGKFINECTEGYDIAFQRALGMAMLLGISNEWVNAQRPIIDLWKGKDSQVRIMQVEKK